MNKNRRREHGPTGTVVDLAINIAPLAGHGALRLAVKGLDETLPQPLSWGK
jgi:hypothetical protein